MGNIKTSFVKRIGKQLFDEHGEEFTEDFSANKEIVDKFIGIKSKKLRNITAGYITRLKKQSTESSE